MVMASASIESGTICTLVGRKLVDLVGNRGLLWSDRFFLAVVDNIPFPYVIFRSSLFSFLVAAADFISVIY